MSDQKIDRRDFLDAAVKAVAVAAGLTVPEVRALLAQELQTRQLRPQQRAGIQVDFALNALKVIVEQDSRVFDTAFGHMIPGDLLTDEGFRDPGIGGDFRGVVDCGEFYSTGGGSCSELSSCDVYGCTPDGGSGGGQGCSTIHVCSPDDCDQGSCPEKACFPDNCKLDRCEKRYESNIVSQEVFERFEADAYIQNLMTRYQLATPAQLAEEVSGMLIQRHQAIFRQRPLKP